MTLHQIAIHSFGVSVGIQTNDRSLLEKLRGLLPVGGEPADPRDVDAWFTLRHEPATRVHLPRYRVYFDDTVVADERRWAPLAHALDSHLRHHVGRRAPAHVFVHAGVVGWRGHAIVFPGNSGAGKTTLVADLIRAGATYLSDEYAVFDADGLVHPFPRRLSVREVPLRRVARDATADLGAETQRGPLPVGVIIHTQYGAAARWDPRPIPQGLAAMTLFAHTLGASDRPQFVLEVLGRMAHAAPSIITERGEAAATIADVLAYAESVIPTLTDSAHAPHRSH